jgi:hypothetical protein
MYDPHAISMGLDLIEDLIDEGLDEDEAIERTAEFLDALVRLDVLVPEPVGPIAEYADGPIFELLLRAAWRWVQNSDARKARRAERRAARLARRKARRARRQG